jgi:hypothetical protein
MVVFKKPRLMGEVLCETCDAGGKIHTVVRVNPVDVLAWLASQGLIRVASSP